MNSSYKYLIIVLVLLILTGCKKEPTLSEYKFADKNFDVICTQLNPELLKEVVYSFEEDITNHFARNSQKNLSQAYSRTINLGIYGRAKYNEMVSEHTMEIFKILKSDTSLWNVGENSSSLNYDHDLVKCLANNIKDKDLKTTFNALLTTNSMSVKLFGEPLKRKSNLAIKDKYLATYIALDMYYAKLFNVDFDTLQTNKPNN